jgi:hypothetical protein
MKNDDMKFIENQTDCVEQEREEVNVEFKDSRIITTQEIRQFYSLLLKCANNKNYLGRLLVARAIIPFIPIDDIFLHISNIFPKNIKAIKRNHNQAHGRILIVKFALTNYFNLLKTSNFSLGIVSNSEKVYSDIVKFIAYHQNILTDIRCASIKHVYLEIVHLLLGLNKDFSQDKDLAQTAFGATVDFSKMMIYDILFTQKTLRVEGGDFGESSYNIMLLKIYLGEIMKNKAVLREEYMKFIQTFYKNLDNLNEDDISLWQKMFSAMSRDWKSSLSDILLSGTEQTKNSQFQETIIKIMYTIITKNTKLIPITKYFAEIFYETVKTLDNFGQDIQDKVVDILKISYTNNKQNLDLMKELVPLIGLIFKKFSISALDETLIEIMEYFSNPEKPEEGRYAVSRSLKHIFSNFDDILRLPVDQYLKLFNIMLRLVTDENNYIRNKACHILYANSKCIHNDNFGVEFLMDEFVRSILKLKEMNVSADKRQAFEKCVGDFILDLVYVKENSKLKFMHKYDKRIFSLDKPNKYSEDVIIKRALWKWRAEIKELLKDYFETVRGVGIKQYVKDRGIYIPDDFQKEYLDYIKYPISRVEFVFDNMVVSRLIEELFGVEEEYLKGMGEKEKEKDRAFREKYLQNFAVYLE